VFLRAIRLLHQNGASGLRIFPYHSPVGHWRCEFSAGTMPVGQYTTAQGWDLPGGAGEFADPEAVALAFWGGLSDEARAEALVPNAAYAFWYAALLGECGSDRVPWLFNDWVDCRRDGYMGITGAGAAGTFPLPPGEATSQRLSYTYTSPARYEQDLGVAVAAPTAPDARAQNALLRAVEVLHARGASSVRVFPYFAPVGYWRCSLYIAGNATEVRYSEAAGWDLPGSPDGSPRDCASIADGIWALLTDDERERAIVRDPGYVYWYAALVERVGGDAVPVLSDDITDFAREGYIRIDHRGARDRFPLPPGPIAGYPV
jgi:hypothetical protein